MQALRIDGGRWVHLQGLPEIGERGGFVAEFVVHHAECELRLGTGHVTGDLSRGVARFLALAGSAQFAHPLRVQDAEVHVEQAAQLRDRRGAVIDVDVNQAIVIDVAAAAFADDAGDTSKVEWECAVFTSEWKLRDCRSGRIIQTPTSVFVHNYERRSRRCKKATTMTRARSVWRGIVVVVRSGIAAWFIALVLQGIWSALIVGNLQTSPAIPWSVPVIVFLVLLAWRYLGGKWGPRSTAETRRRYLRANAVPARVFLWALLAGSLSIAALAGYWIVMTQLVRMPGNVLPDMSKCPWLMVGTGSVIGPVMEQAGFWGYGQVMLNEKWRAPAAIVIVSIVFALGPHSPGGAVLWPKLVFYFLTSVTFGVMALLTDSILPGLVVHILGDLAFFTLVWPDDSARPLARDTGAYPWFWLHAAQAIAFTALACLAFARLAKVTGRVNAHNLVTSPNQPQELADRDGDTRAR